MQKAAGPACVATRLGLMPPQPPGPLADSSIRPACLPPAVAFGQRAPNRAGAREQGRGMGADLQRECVLLRCGDRRVHGGLQQGWAKKGVMPWPCCLMTQQSCHTALYTPACPGTTRHLCSGAHGGRRRRALPLAIQTGGAAARRPRRQQVGMPAAAAAPALLPPAAQALPGGIRCSSSWLRPQSTAPTLLFCRSARWQDERRDAR